MYLCRNPFISLSRSAARSFAHSVRCGYTLACFGFIYDSSTVMTYLCHISDQFLKWFIGLLPEILVAHNLLSFEIYPQDLNSGLLSLISDNSALSKYQLQYESAFKILRRWEDTFKRSFYTYYDKISQALNSGM